MIVKTIIHIVLSTMLNTGQFPEDLSHKEVECMTEAIFFEAKSETQAGKEAVANVIMNRTKSGLFPSTVCEVTNQKGQFQFKRAAQRKVFDSDQSHAEESALIAIKALQGEIEDNTKGALYFINSKLATHTYWLRDNKKTALIGQHTFYKPRKQ